VRLSHFVYSWNFLPVEVLLTVRANFIGFSCFIEKQQWRNAANEPRDDVWQKKQTQFKKSSTSSGTSEASPWMNWYRSISTRHQSDQGCGAGNQISGSSSVHLIFWLRLQPSKIVWAAVPQPWIRLRCRTNKKLNELLSTTIAQDRFLFLHLKIIAVAFLIIASGEYFRVVRWDFIAFLGNYRSVICPSR